MTPLIIYWTAATQWCIVVPCLVVFAFSFFRQAIVMDNKGENSYSMALPGTLCCLLFIGSMIVTYTDVAHDNKEMADALSAAPPIEERRYHSVQFLGLKPIQQNQADGRYYVNMGSGEMLSFNRIALERMCRTCAQFSNTTALRNNSVFVYKVQVDAPHWWSSGPVLYFSLTRDIFLEGSQSVQIGTVE